MFERVSEVSRMVFHVDVNSAFLSWEASRRVREGQPDLRMVPSAVGGDRELRRGVILAKSIPAKTFGIKTGEPVAAALRKCPNLELVKPDFRLYNRCSGEFSDICRKYAPAVEQYSIDECFLDMSNTDIVYPDKIALAYKIKDEIRDTLGFTVNIGIGENKLLAKMASDFTKPDRVHTLFISEIPEKMWPLPVKDLFSVGAATAEKLERHGMFRIGDIARCDAPLLVSIFGEKQGRHLHNFANGIDNSPVCAEPEAPKGYSNSTTLERDITSYAEAEPVILALSDSTASRMRADGVRAYCITVTTRTFEFIDRSHGKNLRTSTDITGEIYKTAMMLLRELWDGKTPLRLLGVALTEIDRGDAEQLSMFDTEEAVSRRERSRDFDRTVDEIRKKFGSSAIHFGSLGGR